MYKNKANERNNICGTKVRFFRKQFATKNFSKKKLADMLQIAGLDIDKNAIQKIEDDKRFIYRYRIKSISKSFKCSI